MPKTLYLLIVLLLLLAAPSSRGDDATPSIDGICPETVYPDNNNTYSFKINGRSLGDKTKTTVIFNDCNLAVTWLNQSKPDQFDRPYGVIKSDQKEIELWGIHRSKYHGTVKVVVQGRQCSFQCKEC
jgi:hypothetical protein